MTSPDLYKTFNTPDEEPITTLEPGMSLAGRYKLIKQIGRGGMGVVWSAEEKAAGRKVVLKFVPSELKNFESAVAQLKESFRKIHELQHQHICPVYTLEEDVSLGYYHVMKWLDGETLDDYIVRTVGRKQPLPFEDVLRILRPVAEALDYAHGHRIVHRDIKPSNIFIVLDDTKTIRDVQVIDFGLASEIRSSLTRVSQVRFDTSGTRPYMAPEQWRARPQSGPTDQYALAVVAYELLAGYLPFDGEDAEMLRMAVLQDSPEPIREMSEQINNALLRALSKDSSARFENCVNFISALGGEKISDGSKVSSVPTPTQSSGSSGTGPTPVAPGVESLMKRGRLFLEDSDWVQANDYFDRVLDIAPEYAPAYIGKLCAELEVQNEERLGDYEQSISEHSNFIKAVRFADIEYKAKVEGYDEKISERFRQRRYDRLVRSMERASENEYLELAGQFRAMNGYKDTIALSLECERQYRQQQEQHAQQERQAQERKQEDHYKQLCGMQKTVSTETDWQNLAAAFLAMNGYGNTAELANECYGQFRSLKEKREEQSRVEESQRKARRKAKNIGIGIIGGGCGLIPGFFLGIIIIMVFFGNSTSYVPGVLMALGPAFGVWCGVKVAYNMYGSYH